jgi:hypothetical protein
MVVMVVVLLTRISEEYEWEWGSVPAECALLGSDYSHPSTDRQARPSFTQTHTIPPFIFSCTSLRR